MEWIENLVDFKMGDPQTTFLLNVIISFKVRAYKKKQKKLV